MAKKKKSAATTKKKNTNSIFQLSEEMKKLISHNSVQYKPLLPYLINSYHILRSGSVHVIAMAAPKKKAQKKIIEIDYSARLSNILISAIKSAMSQLVEKNMKYRFQEKWLEDLIKSSTKSAIDDLAELDGSSQKVGKGGSTHSVLEVLFGIKMVTDPNSYASYDSTYQTPDRTYHDGTETAYYSSTIDGYVTETVTDKDKKGKEHVISTYTWETMTGDPDTNAEKKKEAKDSEKGWKTKDDASHAWPSDPHKPRKLPAPDDDRPHHINVSVIMTMSVFKQEAKQLLKDIDIKSGGDVDAEQKHINAASLAKLDAMMHGALTKAFQRTLDAKGNKYGQRAKRQVMITSNMIFDKRIGITDPPKMQQASISVNVK